MGTSVNGSGPILAEDENIRNFLQKYPENVDVHVVIMGRSGVGKSEFINEVLREEYGHNLKPEQLMKVEHTLRRCTTEVRTAGLRKTSEGRRIVLVDTPGLDGVINGNEDQAPPIETVANWLRDIHTANLLLAGIIWLFDISQNALCLEDYECLRTLQELCGADSLSRILIATTKWEKERGEQTEKIMSLEKFLEPITKAGAKFVQGKCPARDIIAKSLAGHNSGAVLQIQDEMGVKRKPFSKTIVGASYLRTHKPASSDRASGAYAWFRRLFTMGRFGK
ncbi:hypothetical protein JR316_0002953 [Psilocybe cubensis]|uniref:AIG1-type G domain-containing protein n=2 Tax=Psilocybe cubensis TaxID=181762 RepID=A0A8H7Y4N1_PSICU|nr:hypothetical protein JR316_0002953 [Psilocybe cubensis]KAH9483485.1 hypothetical protein JR316_0002953 [Psilocybe cubensis]